jgi:hypothetical protein
MRSLKLQEQVQINHLRDPVNTSKNRSNQFVYRTLVNYYLLINVNYCLSLHLEQIPLVCLTSHHPSSWKTNDSAIGFSRVSSYPYSEKEN